MRRSLQLKVTNRRKYPAATSTAFELALAVPTTKEQAGSATWRSKSTMLTRPTNEARRGFGPWQLQRSFTMSQYGQAPELRLVPRLPCTLLMPSVYPLSQQSPRVTSSGTTRGARRPRGLLYLLGFSSCIYTGHLACCSCTCGHKCAHSGQTRRGLHDSFWGCTVP